MNVNWVFTPGSRLRGVFTRGSRLRVPSVLVVAFALFTVSCGEPTPERSVVDTRLESHAVLPGTPSAAGLAYVRAIADAHRIADGIGDRQARITHLLVALDQAPPAADGTAELLHIELLARTAELMLEAGEAERALGLLGPRLATATSLPIDRGSARCLVALGDAAAQTGDHDLAMGSYARALEMLSLLLEEAQP